MYGTTTQSEKKRSWRRRRRIIWVVVLLVLAIVLGCAVDLVTNKVFHLTYEELSQRDQDMLQAVSRMFQAEAAQETPFWPDFNLEDLPLIMVSRTMGFLRGRSYTIHLEMDRGLSTQILTLPLDLQLGNVYRLSALNLETFGLWMAEGNGERENIAGEEAVVIRYDGETSARDIVVTVVQSVFRQQVLSAHSLATRSTVSVLPATQYDITLKGIEYGIIDKMLSSETQEALETCIAQFVAVREARYAATENLERQETTCELTLGCANYIAYQLLEAMGETETFFQTSHSAASFTNGFYQVTTSGYGGEGYFAGAGNGETGAALCYVLDMLGIEDWQASIEAGTESRPVTPYSLLKAYCEANCPDYESLDLDRIWAEYSGDQLATWAANYV